MSVDTFARKGFLTMTNETTKAVSMLGKLTTVVAIAILAVSSVFPAQKALGLVESVRDGLMFKVRHTATFSEDALVFGELRGYDTVRLRDGDWVNEPGKPMLPAQTVGIALPAGMAVSNVRLVRSTSVPLAGEHTVFPAQPPRQTSGLPMEDEFLAPKSRGLYLAPGLSCETGRVRASDGPGRAGHCPCSRLSRAVRPG